LTVSSRRLLLLIPTTTYRTEDFVEAARAIGVDLVVASDRPNVLSGEFPDHLLALPFADPAAAVESVRRYAARRPLDAVVPVDDLTTEVAARICGELGLRSSPVGAVTAARNKLVMRERLAAAGVPSPRFASFAVDADPASIARQVSYPCVLKPLVLSASRGVIRADSEADFAAAFRRISAILASPDVAEFGPGAERILVEEFVAGREVALEGLLVGGILHVLALFDKPDPLDGPFFEETIYVTPSRLPGAAQAAVIETTARAAKALGLAEGPVHAELRVGLDAGASDVAWMIEIAARSIGGLCSRTLSFGTGMSLEEIILRHALDLPIASLERERRAAGVMMIPIPNGGVLEDVLGLDQARAVPLIEDVVISMHKGQDVIPLPEGSRYLGFIFSRAETPAQAEAALRQAHAHLRFTIR
jgi:biotin carboxylase